MSNATTRIQLPAPPSFTNVAAPHDKPLPIEEPITGRIYVSVQDDWWDLISLRVYGMRRGDDHLMHKLIEANYHLREISNFPAGVAVIVPPQPVKTQIPLVPWKKTSIVQTQ